MRNALCRLSLVLWVGAGCQDAAEQGAAIDGDDVSLAGHGLQMTVSPLRKAVPVEGPLQVEITIRNHSDTAVQFRPIFNIGGWLEADIVDSAGSLIPKTASIDPPNAPAVSLGNGESITDTVDLRCSLRLPAGIPCMAAYDLSRPGEYQVRLRYTLPCDIEGCGKLVTIEAEPFTVGVREARQR